MDQEKRPNETIIIEEEVKSSNSSNSNNNFNDDFNINTKGIVSKFLSFDTFITPSLIKIIYIIGVILTAFTALGMIFMGSALMGLGLLVLSPFIPRIGAEMLMVKFKTLEVLEEINKKQ